MELTFDRVTKQFKNKIAVDRVSLSLQKGVYGLLGANGAGKTTLMRMMCGVLKPDSGEIRLGDLGVEEEDYRDKLGYLPQQFGYYPEFTGEDFLMYMAALKGISKRQAKERTAELLDTVNLTDVAKKKIRTYSGGMKQRLGIAQVLINHPQVLVLDEPTAGLDPKERVKFRNLISQLGSNRIVLLSTHIVSDIEYIADTILVMKEGSLIHQGGRSEIMKVIQGKVWETAAEAEAADRWMERYPVLNIRQEKDRIFLRLVSEEPPTEDSISVAATLEDLYLYYFSEEGGKHERNYKSGRIRI